MPRRQDDDTCRGPYIIDACTLIDYQKSDLLILGLFAKHFGPVYIAEPVLSYEVKGFSSQDCRRLGLEIASLKLHQLVEAVKAKGQISEFDACSLILARDNKWTLITGDKVLWKCAQAVGVRCIRGLRPMVILVNAGHLPPSLAAATVEKMGIVNPGYMSAAIIEEFRQQIGLSNLSGK